MAAPVVHELSPGTAGGDLVVLAHGLEDSWESWRPLARAFDPRWRVLALDLPWRAGNDYRWRRQGSVARWLAAGLDQLPRPADTVVAHSFGANATLELMASGRPPARAAVLICPLYCPPEQPITWQVFDRARRTFDRHVRDGLRLRIGERLRTLDAAVLEAMIAKAIDRIGPAGFLTVFDQFVASGGLALTTVDTPTLILAGGADPTLSAAAAATLGRDMPRANLLVHEHYDHFCHVRHAAEVAEQAARFVGAANRVTVRP
ncbi:alpha/beta fold hydrolase [Micromonospora craterilacus]|uniref:alpha/beta fold hydrolase n=1 Tax=Micromonospora craterilacus TaxID=1655439 RepID=UPI003F695DC0